MNKFECPFGEYKIARDFTDMGYEESAVQCPT